MAQQSLIFFDVAVLPRVSLERAMENRNTSGRISGLTELLEECDITEVTSMIWAPAYTKGDMLFIHRGCRLKQHDRVSLTTRNGRHVLGLLIEKHQNQMIIHTFNKSSKIECFEEIEIASVSKIIAAVYRC